ncbi:hypothetical protein Tco_0873430 [Tanacetum coccineum]|uniref:Uncharacterized protein n=1 Tax=Tanacetum coccineum TaxID=301880 RepID=A0ABQ5BPD2_9ASTR
MVHNPKNHPLNRGTPPRSSALLFKAWQLNIYKKNSSISSKPDRAHICIINPVSKKLCINEAGVGTNNDYSLRSFVNSAYGNNDVSSTFMNNNGDVELSTPVMRTQTFLMSKVLVVGRITDGAQNNTGQCDLIFEGLFYYFARFPECDGARFARKAGATLRRHHQKLVTASRLQGDDVTRSYDVIIMDPNTCIGRLCLGENDRVSLNDGIESEGNWDTSEYRDTADSGRKKILNHSLFIGWRRKNDDELDELLASIDVSDLPPSDITDIPPFMCSMGKSARNKKQPSKNYKISYNGERPSLTVKRLLTRVELSREELENDIYERILILNEPRLIIETLKYSDQHKKLLDSVLLDKLKLDGELEVEEEANTGEFIRSYKAITEKMILEYLFYRFIWRQNSTFML